MIRALSTPACSLPPPPRRQEHQERSVDLFVDPNLRGFDIVIRNEDRMTTFVCAFISTGVQLLQP